MIKTVSFAPPRSSGSRSSAKAASAKTVPAEALRPNSPRAASGRTAKTAPAQTSLEFNFDAPEELAAPAKIPAAEPPAAETAFQAPASVKKAPKAAKTAPLAEAPAIEAKAAPEMQPTVQVRAEVMKTEVIKAAPGEAEKLQPKAKTLEVKAKRARVPKDFAAQYGEKVVERVVTAPVEAGIVKKRLNKVERQARRDLIKPSEGLLERLARANQIAARRPQAEPRGKGWKFVCGRCGVTSYFETPAGLCACGTIAMKE